MSEWLLASGYWPLTPLRPIARSRALPSAQMKYPFPLQSIRSLLLVCAMLLSASAMTQPNRFPPIEYKSKASKGSNSLYTTLEADTTKDLIVGFSVVNNFSGYSRKLHVVYKTNGRVFLFHSKKRHHSEAGSELVKDVLSRKDSREFRRLLWSTFEATEFKLVQDSLNSTTLTKHPDLSVSIADGSNYFLSIRGPQGYSGYSSYEAESFIHHKVVGWRQRQRFMNIWNGYMSKFKEYQEGREKIGTSTDH